jgi:AbrB family looped-hinge helix DNA binding protein
MAMVVYLLRKENYDMETYATVKGQIVIPAPLRRKYGIKNGTKIIIIDNGDSISLKPVTEQYLRNLQGSLKGKGALKVLVDERRDAKARE